MELNEACEKAPERVWLQGKDGFDDAGNAATWCEEKINDDDIEYIRADLVERWLKRAKTGGRDE